MKRLFIAVIAAALACSLSLAAFADEPVTETVVSEAEDGSTVVVNVTVPMTVEIEEPAAADPVLEDESVAVVYSTISVDDTEGTDAADSIPGVLTALFGEYQPRTQTVTEVLTDGTTVSYQECVPGLAGLDWLWIGSVCLFGMVVYCIFRMIGGCLKWI